MSGVENKAVRGECNDVFITLSLMCSKGPTLIGPALVGKPFMKRKHEHGYMCCFLFSSGYSRTRRVRSHERTVYENWRGFPVGLFSHRSRQVCNSINM